MGWSNIYTTVIVLSGTNPGLFIYQGKPAAGNLIGSWTPSSGTDEYGNAYPQGLTLSAAASGLTQSIFSVISGGNTVASIDGSGNLTGQTVSANTDLIVAGESFLNLLQPSYAKGIINQGNLPGNHYKDGYSGQFMPLELDALIPAGVDVRITAPAAFMQCSGLTTPGNVYFYLLATTDGSTPTFSDTLLELLTQVDFNGDFYSPNMSVIIPNKSAAYTLRVGWGLYTPEGVTKVLGAQWLFIENIGNGDDGSNNSIVYTPSTPPPTPPTTHQETWSPSGVYWYQGSTSEGQPNTLIPTGGSSGKPAGQIGQGGDGPDTFNGDSYSFIVMPDSMATAVEGATINWAKLTLYNTHTWYDSGGTCQIGYTGQTSFGNTQPQPDATVYVTQQFTEGQAVTINLPAAMLSALKSGNQTFVILANTSDLQYYMLFAGMKTTLEINWSK